MWMGILCCEIHIYPAFTGLRVCGDGLPPHSGRARSRRLHRAEPQIGWTTGQQRLRCVLTEEAKHFFDTKCAPTYPHAVRL